MSVEAEAETKIKIFHCADLHLDSPFSLSTPAQAEQRKIELRSAFTSAIMVAKQEKVELFFISGDLFDSEYVTRDTAELLISEFNSFPDCRFFISPGNHDPYNDISPYKTVAFPQNVHIFGGIKEKVEIPELNVNVYGVGFTSMTYMSSPAVGYGQLDKSKINILVCHGDMTSPLSSNGPVTKAEIAQSGFDYIALGHIHAPSGVCKEGGTYYAYPGCLEGRSFDEPGYHGALIGTVSKGEVNLKSMRFSKRRYETIRVDVTDVYGKSAIIETIRGIIRPYGNDTAIRVIMTGTVPEPLIITPAEIGKGYEYPFRIEIIDSTVPSIDFTKLERDTTLKGVFYSKMTDRLSKCVPGGDDYAKLLMALKYGISALYDRNIIDFGGGEGNE
ncbi:MAG: metallophosphoesterase [Victivallales bacterium]